MAFASFLALRATAIRDPAFGVGGAPAGPVVDAEDDERAAERDF
jgi:hypothetical protein